MVAFSSSNNSNSGGGGGSNSNNPAESTSTTAVNPTTSSSNNNSTTGLTSSPFVVNNRLLLSSNSAGAFHESMNLRGQPAISSFRPQAQQPLLNSNINNNNSTALSSSQTLSQQQQQQQQQEQQQQNRTGAAHYWTMPFPAVPPAVYKTIQARARRLLQQEKKMLTVQEQQRAMNQLRVKLQDLHQKHVDLQKRLDELERTKQTSLDHIRVSHQTRMMETLGDLEQQMRAEWHEATEKARQEFLQVWEAECQQRRQQQQEKFAARIKALEDAKLEISDASDDDGDSNDHGDHNGGKDQNEGGAGAAAGRQDDNKKDSASDSALRGLEESNDVSTNGTMSKKTKMAGEDAANSDLTEERPTKKRKIIQDSDDDDDKDQNMQDKKPAATITSTTTNETGTVNPVVANALDPQEKIMKQEGNGKEEKAAEDASLMLKVDGKPTSKNDSTSSHDRFTVSSEIVTIGTETAVAPAANASSSSANTTELASDLKKREHQELQDTLESLNEKKSELIWLLKQVIKVEEKEKAKLSAERKAEPRVQSSKQA